MADDRFDGLFMNAVQQSQGIENFFDNLFGFMRRKTDFFSAKDKSRGMVISAFEKSEKLFNEDKARQALIARKKAEEKAKQEAAEAAARQQTAEPAADSSCVEVTDEEARQIELEEAAKKAGKPVPTPAAKIDEEKKEEGEGEEKGLKPNHMNGSSTDKYTWGQTLEEVTVNVILPEGATSKTMSVSLTSKKLVVKMKTGAVIVEGDWHKAIKTDDSLWCIETDSSGKKFL
jgi:hypothetical protein